MLGFVLPGIAKEYRIKRSGSRDGVHYDYVDIVDTPKLYKQTCLRPGEIECPPLSYVTVGQDQPVEVNLDQLYEVVIGHLEAGDPAGMGQFGGAWYTWSAVMEADGQTVIIRLESSREALLQP